ncbi:LysR family transcriptional regulator [Microbacteriaceae bacterium K1510]|nr:LysR family transcriptional regulator [Microbacteriaceae bacterium K1510]
MSNYRVHAAAVHYFDAVRHARSIRGAAAILNVASSAVNRQILNLEAGLGAQLFERAPSGLKLTAAGEVFARHVNTVLTDTERMRAELNALKGIHAGHVEIATIEGLCNDIIPDALALMRAKHPRITTRVSILRTEEIPEAVLNGDAHLGLGFHVERRPGLRQIAVSSFLIGAVVSAQSPLAAARSLSIYQLANANLIVPAGNFALRAQVAPLLAEAGGAARPFVESGSIELMKQLALADVGVAFLTRVSLAAELQSGRLRHVPLMHRDKPIYSELGLYARKASTLPVAADAFAQYLGQVMSRRQAEEQKEYVP